MRTPFQEEIGSSWVRIDIYRCESCNKEFYTIDDDKECPFCMTKSDRYIGTKEVSISYELNRRTGKIKHE